MLDGQKLSVFCNLRGTEQALAPAFEAPGGRILIGNYADDGTSGQAVRIETLRPYETVAVLW
jgi:hypothetical protein